MKKFSTFLPVVLFASLFCVAHKQDKSPIMPVNLGKFSGDMCYIVNNQTAVDVTVVFGVGKRSIPWGQQPLAYISKKGKVTAIVPVEQRWHEKVTTGLGKKKTFNALKHSRGDSIVFLIGGKKLAKTIPGGQKVVYYNILDKDGKRTLKMESVFECNIDKGSVVYKLTKGEKERKAGILIDKRNMIIQIKAPGFWDNVKNWFGKTWGKVKGIFGK
ncbi:hypothetical protein HN446_05280 [bacterium]|jgi:hypothetical protein|nr:hypothetical protein [bacterium]